MIKMKNRTASGLLFLTGGLSIFVESTASHITSIHPSVVMMLNRVTIELFTLSKLEALLTHSPPQSKQSNLSVICSTKSSGTFTVLHQWKVPLKKFVHRIAKRRRKRSDTTITSRMKGMAFINAVIAILRPWFLLIILNGLRTLSILKVLITPKSTPLAASEIFENNTMKKSMMFQLLCIYDSGPFIMKP